MTEQRTILIAFDVETSGLDPYQDEIVEIAGVRFELGGPVLDSFVSLVRPTHRLSDRVQAIHGITNDMLTDQPPLAEVMGRFVRWLGPRPTLVAHNAPFDAGFLYQAAIKTDTVTEPWRIIDTLELARRCFRKLAHHNLASLLRHIGFHPSGKLHRALMDAEGAAALLNAMLDHCAPDQTGHEPSRDHDPIPDRQRKTHRQSSPDLQRESGHNADHGNELPNKPTAQQQLTLDISPRPQHETTGEQSEARSTVTPPILDRRTIVALAMGIKEAADCRQYRRN